MASTPLNKTLSDTQVTDIVVMRSRSIQRFHPHDHRCMIMGA